ncbi:MAG TPA: hypothetical protein VFT59_05400 [Candidatus Saccharimonadales bacterium]|nr:hypothetical protein [Candidatus Saccharimonadales bacterium]
MTGYIAYSMTGTSREMLRASLARLSDRRPDSFAARIAVGAIRLYQRYSYKRSVCRHPRGSNCSAVVAKGYAHYGFVVGTIVAITILFHPKLEAESGYDFCNCL